MLKINIFLIYFCASLDNRSSFRNFSDDAEKRSFLVSFFVTKIIKTFCKKACILFS